MAGGARLVVVGFGMGEYHARLISAVDGLVLHGICDLDPAKREKAKTSFPSARIYRDYQEVLEDRQVDAAVIVTPHNVHAQMAIAAMEAGKHAITDKAMCLTVEEADAMIASRDRNKVLLSVFQNRRWDSDFLTVRKVIEEGIIGRPHHIQSAVTGSLLWGGWRTRREQMGGWLYDWGAHLLDQILLLAKSEATHVYAFQHFRDHEPFTVEDYVNATITFANGLTATAVVGCMNRIQMPRWYVMGERGALESTTFESPVRAKTLLNELETELQVSLVKGDWKSYYQNIAEVLAGKAELAVRPEQIVPQIAIAEAAYASIATRQVVRLGV